MVIIRNVTVINGNDSSTDAEVVVADGRFSAIRPVTDEQPAIDGHGGYLVPGLCESHTHLLGPAMGQPENERIAHLSGMLAGYLSAGVTTVMDFGGPTDLASAYRKTASDSVARFLFAGRSFTGIRGWPILDNSMFKSVAHEIDDPDKAYALTLEQLDEVDFIKCIYDGDPDTPERLPLEAMRAIASAAHEKGKKMLVHVHHRGDIDDAIAVGADGIEHAFLPDDPSSTAEAADVAAQLAETGTYYCPTMVTFEQIAHNGEPNYLEGLVEDGLAKTEDIPRIMASPLYDRPFPRHPADEARIRLDYAMRTLGLMYDAGVKIAAGSDVAMLMPAPPIALFRELQLMAKAGLPLHAVLAAGTRHAAGKIGQDANIGTIRPGAAADALLLDANPLTDLTHLIDPSHRVWTLRNGQLS